MLHSSTPPLRRWAPRLSSVALALLSAPAALADTLVVDPAGSGDFAGLQAAINAANDGDVLVLIGAATDSHVLLPAVTIDGKGLTLVSRSVPEPRIASIRIRNLPRPSVVLLDGLVITETFGTAVEVLSCMGPVRLERCIVSGTTALSAVASREVSIVDTSLYANGGLQLAALRADASRVICERARVTGANGPAGWWNGGLICGDGVDGTAGARLTNRAHLWASGSTFTGGRGGLSPSALCTSGSDAPAIESTVSSHIFFRASSADPAPAAGTIGRVSVTPLLSVVVPPNATSGERIIVEVAGQPGDVTFIAIGLADRSRFRGAERGWEQLTASPRHPLQPLVPLGTVPPTGVLRATAYLPEVPLDQVIDLGVQVHVLRPGVGRVMSVVRTIPVVGDAGPVVVGGGVARVDHAAAPGGDGRSWQGAFDELSTALGRAWSRPGLPVEVWVREGTYHAQPAGGDPALRFRVPPGTLLYGGFAGNEPSSAGRDPLGRPTTLSADVARDDGSPTGSTTDNAPSLILASGDDRSPATVVDGFVLEGARDTNALQDWVVRADCELHLRRSVFRDCASTGLDLFGLVSFEVGGRMESCVVRGNEGLGVQFSAPRPGRTNVVSGCLISANTMNFGGVLTMSPPATIASSTIAYNLLPSHASALAWFDEAGVRVTNSIVFGNVRGTVSDFRAQIGISPQASLNDFSIDHCIVEHWSGQVPGSANLDVVPGFRSPGPDGVFGTADDDLRLGPGSPAIDSGNNGLVPMTLTVDLDGRPRFADDPAVPDTGVGSAPITDRGAYER